LGFRLLHLIATVIDACDHHRPGRGPGHPPTETIRVVATLRRFLREGTPWRSLTATAVADQARHVPCADAAVAVIVDIHEGQRRVML
jgi:hypothetical protein